MSEITITTDELHNLLELLLHSQKACETCHRSRLDRWKPKGKKYMDIRYGIGIIEVFRVTRC